MQGESCQNPSALLQHKQGVGVRLCWNTGGRVQTRQWRDIQGLNNNAVDGGHIIVVRIDPAQGGGEPDYLGA